ncbi:MAG TPA: 2-oxo acid dehydrogenase subunit E2, partial [Phaeodactylibacter sp.]|nr:2-oxo acid dehydrogenase subunit E2 [Phaeodactylibacter sp.]
MSVVEMKVPTIGESITEVTLAQWLVEDGGYVELDQPICEFESDKATLEFPAEASGKLMHVAAEEDDLEIGALVAKIDTSVSKDDGGGEKDDSGDAQQEAEEKTDEKEEAPAPAEEEKEESYAAGHPSPAAAKILKENDIDPESVKGTGRDGRITKEDAQKAVESKKQRDSHPQPEAKTSGQPGSGGYGERKEAPAPKEDKGQQEQPKQVVFSSSEDFSRETERKKMSRMRRTIAKRLVSAKNETAMLTTFNEVDLTEVMKLRKKYQERFVEKYGIKLGFMSLFAKACAKALMEMPDVNASIDGDHLVY